MHIYRHNIVFNLIIHNNLEIAILIGRWTRKLRERERERERERDFLKI